MKKSKRLIRNTILALNGMMVLYVGINRLYAVSSPTQAAQRTSTAELALLRDFTAIEVNGDFSVDVVQEADYAVAFAPAAANQGDFVATLRGNTLVLHGFHNTRANRARVALPVLTHLDAELVPVLSISGFNGTSLSLQLDGTPQVILRNNGIRQWHIVASEVDELKIDKASLAAGKVDLAGRATLTAID
jgi:hypothetical protein